SHLVLTDCSLSIGSFRNYLKQYTIPTTTHQEPSLPRVFFFCTLDLKIDTESRKHHSTNKKSEMTTISTNTQLNTGTSAVARQTMGFGLRLLCIRQTSLNL